MDEQKVNVTPITDNVETQAVETPKTDEVAKLNPKDVLRDLSKEYGVNLFEESGLQQFKEKLSSTHKELETLKGSTAQYDAQLKEYQAKEQDYQIKIDALGLGFRADNLDEVLALAKVNTKEGQTLQDGLKVVKERYGSVFTSQKGIGTQHNDMKGDKPDLPKSEAEAYLNSNPRYRAYQKTQK